MREKPVNDLGNRFPLRRKAAVYVVGKVGPEGAYHLVDHAAARTRVERTNSSQVAARRNDGDVRDTPSMVQRQP